VIRNVAFCPHPPVLVPELAGAAAPELDVLRGAALAAIGDLAAASEQIVVLGAGSRSQRHSPLAHGSLAGFGLGHELNLGAPGCGGSTSLPLSLTVAAWLLRESVGVRSGAVGFEIADDFDRSPAARELLSMLEAGQVGLLVMGDGTACRTTAAPGYLDERAEPYDEVVSAALACGDAAGLSALDPVLGAELLAAGVPAWRVAGALLEGAVIDARMRCAEAPYGVWYPVASWTVRG
jgi:hypothetical protein